MENHKQTFSWTNQKLTILGAKDSAGVPGCAPTILADLTGLPYHCDVPYIDCTVSACSVGSILTVYKLLGHTGIICLEDLTITTPIYKFGQTILGHCRQVISAQLNINSDYSREVNADKSHYAYIQKRFCNITVVLVVV